MNKLLKMLKEFGLIFAIREETEDQTIKICHSLKRADNPVIIFDFSTDHPIDQVHLSNTNEDMFIGASCPCEYEVIKGAFLSGAHFVLTPPQDIEVVSTCLSKGYDIIAEVSSTNEIDLFKNLRGEALVLNVEDRNFNELITYALFETSLVLFLRGKKEKIDFDQWRNHPQIAAFIIDECFESNSGETVYLDTLSTINQLIGIKYISLSLQKNSERLEEAKVFSSLSVIPLINNSDRDQLLIEVQDMDRFIAHLKWKGIYMDPFSAKMKGDMILETELYTEFLGWNVKLINGK